MTEAEWLTGEFADLMLEHLRATAGVARLKSGRRKLRLFGCACCRQVWHLMTDERSRRAVEVGERFADGLAGTKERARAEAEAAAALTAIDRDLGRRMSTDGVSWPDLSACHAAQAAVFALSAGHAVGAAQSVVRCARVAVEWAAFDECQRCMLGQCALVREVFGNPFRPAPVDPSWLARNDGAAVKLARAIHDEHLFGDLPVLADALEEAGCRDEAVLAHCRQPGGHVPGCRVVDAVLGRG
jgi:hypothetical protein